MQIPWPVVASLLVVVALLLVVAVVVVVVVASLLNETFSLVPALGRPINPAWQNDRWH